MPKEKDPVKAEETTQQDFYVGVVERPNPYISEQKIHEKLGDIHKNRPKRLTDEEKEIIRRWKEWNLKDLPEDWQNKYQNLIKVSEVLGEWKKVFGELTPSAVKIEYDKPKESHSQEQINQLGKLNNLSQLEKDSEDYAQWQTVLNQFLFKYGVDKLGDLVNYIENLKNSTKLTDEQQEAIKNYSVVKKERDDWQTAFPKKTVEEVKKSVRDNLKELNDWHTTFSNKTPNEVLTELNAKPTTIATPLSEEEKNKIKNYDTLLREKDKLLIRLKNKEQEAPSPLSKKISDEIIKSYKAPTHLYGYYLKLMNSFKDWTIYGNDEQQLATKQNEVEIDKVIRFLLTHQPQDFKNQNIY